ncbi:MAG TPA: hypothetical protein VEA99_16480 [Gemmatimonadaceae bacterium]|nr:hypothetical protein [Gemmatimonadaceae bacterium]
MRHPSPGRGHGPAWRTLAMLAAIPVATACDREPVRLVAGVRDTVVVHALRSTPLPVRALDPRGRPRALEGVRFAWLSGDRVAISDSGRVTCERPAEARVQVRAGTLASTFVLRCRPIRGFRRLDDVQLTVGDPPQPFVVGAIGVDGADVTQLHGSAVVADTAVARLDAAGMLHAVGRGNTAVMVEAGDCRMLRFIDVWERADSTRAMRPYEVFEQRALRLAAGELRRWPLSPGIYTMELQPDSRSPGALELLHHQVNCTRTGEGQRYYCAALPNAMLVVRHPGPAGRGADRVARLTVRRLYAPLDDRGTPVRRWTSTHASNLYRCPLEGVFR